jgi:hypothetical protein
MFYDVTIALFFDIPDLIHSRCFRTIIFCGKFHKDKKMHAHLESKSGTLIHILLTEKGIPGTKNHLLKCLAM